MTDMQAYRLKSTAQVCVPSIANTAGTNDNLSLPNITE